MNLSIETQCETKRISLLSWIFFRELVGVVRKQVHMLAPGRGWKGTLGWDAGGGWGSLSRPRTETKEQDQVSGAVSLEG